MDSKITSIAYSTFTNKGAYALLLGSGISSTSGIPTGWQITLRLIEKLALLETQSVPADPVTWYQDYYNQEPDYSDILDKLTNTPEERLNLVRPFIEPNEDEREQGLKTPTQAHHRIAQLVRGGYIRVIVTTNFDRLLENALKEIGVEPTVISNPNHVENAIPLIHSSITIVKINGDYLDTTFLNIKSELSHYDSRLVDQLKFIFENFGLVTCGWSAKWDIALVDVLKSASKFRYSTYLTYLGRADDELVTLSTFRRGQLVQITGADSLFSELAEGLEALERHGEQHPLTPTLILYRVKKYLVKEEYIISLHNLFESATSAFIPHIAYEMFNQVPTADTIKSLIEQYESRINILLMLMAQGGYWAKPYQYSILVNTIRRVAVEPNNTRTNSYAAWVDIVYLPTLLLRYACGIAGIANNNFKLVHKITSLEIPTRYGKSFLSALTAHKEVIDNDWLKEIYATQSNVAMSDWLYKNLRAYFKELIPIDRDYEYAFNYYEFLTSIVHYIRDKHQWVPTGRFKYSNQDIVSAVLELAKDQGVDFELIKAGFFDSVDNATTEISAFQKFLDR